MHNIELYSLHIRCIPSLMRYLFIAICLFGLTAAAIAEQTVKNVDIVYIKKETETLPKMSNIEPLPKDDGVLGGKQGIEDSNTTGKFLGNHYTLESVILEENGEVAKTFNDLFKRGMRHFVVDLGVGGFNWLQPTLSRESNRGFITLVPTMIFYALNNADIIFSILCPAMQCVPMRLLNT